MNLKLHDTLSRRVKVFKPLKPGQVKLYTCGPTVYDYMHIGNLRTFVFYDTLHRTLAATGYDVKHVMNITDVGHLVSDADEGEDKLEKGAARAGQTVWQVAEHFTKAFHHDLKQLNIVEPEIVGATEFIEGQIAMVQILLDKDYAYQTEQAIYFDVSKLTSYGELTGQKLADKEVGARHEVVTDANKRHPQDFAVWFFTTGKYADHTMRWPSPWGEGFPGWHLECSAIIHQTLSEPIDIHAGGVDLIGTHHTNEMAQTEASYGVKLADYWLHAEHLLVEGQKMSKSLGNFFTLKDVIKKGYDPLAIRLLYLQAHYRSQMNFTWDSLAAAAAALQNLRAWADRVHQLKAGPTNELLAKIKASLADDLNTAHALALLSDFSAEQPPSRRLLERLDELFGLALAGRPGITAAQKELIKKREAARTAKDWTAADQLRGELAKAGLEINDTDDGPLWHRL